MAVVIIVLAKYKRLPMSPVVAVQINLDTEGVYYNKWGSIQKAKRGDWLVNNNGECYTIDNESFQKTYSSVSTGLYVKTSSVWAEEAYESGFINTKEGKSSYTVGDMLVYNNKDRTDGYCMSKQKFDKIYILDTNK